jgi:hypothetical protein
MFIFVLICFFVFKKRCFCYPNLVFVYTRMNSINFRRLTPCLQYVMYIFCIQQKPTQISSSHVNDVAILTTIFVCLTCYSRYKLFYY